ncbi:MAG TPA: serine--tRNA ligase, partial [Candidatus Saccharimonadia bacterium]|nr:serine--tRNA ligase [Candidatus Saccharimonadia bacterium]
MIDIRFLREHPDVVKAASKNKNAHVSSEDIDTILELDTRRRDLLTQVETVRRERNELAEGLKRTKPDAKQIVHGKSLRAQLSKLEEEYAQVDTQFTSLLKLVPNIPADDVPIGRSEDENVVVKTVGAKPTFDFEPKNHWQLAELHGWIDKERAAKVAGSRFAYLKGNLVKLQFALIQYVLDVLTDEEVLKHIEAANKLNVSTRPFIPVLPPYMIRTELYEAMDRLEPKDERYKLEDDDLWLQGSAEHVLGSMHAGEIFQESELPLRYVGYATSFRREAGTYGKDMEGIIRMHQFDKLEMESFTLPDTSYSEHLFMIAIQEYLMEKLQIPYQVLMKCTADIGKPNARGVDIEAWLPGQGKYRETHTADYMTDYQTRRLGVRVRRFVPAPEQNSREETDTSLQSGSKLELVHTNDATAFAMGRAL